MRKNVTTGAPWEDIVGYCRAVQVGNVVEISGTTAIYEGKVLYPNDAYNQTKEIIRIAEGALKQVGGKLSHVVRTRMYTTNILLWEEIGRAHGESFKAIKPATTMVEVSALIDPDMLIEIEFTAILD